MFICWHTRLSRLNSASDVACRDHVVAHLAAPQLDPAAAFRKYADDLIAESAVSSVSLLPGELCGYSGQKLMGAWSDTPQNAVQYEDRIVHIWTNSGNNYLVAVHVQAPTGTPGFDAAAEVLTDDFDIALP